MSSVPLDAIKEEGKTFLGHPRGLYICFATELWERFSFYGMKFLLLLYLTKYHLFTDEAGYDVLGAYAGLVYALPLGRVLIQATSHEALGAVHAFLKQQIQSHKTGDSDTIRKR